MTRMPGCTTSRLRNFLGKKPNLSVNPDEGRLLWEQPFKGAVLKG
jgi:hypothetical protein